MIANRFKRLLASVGALESVLHWKRRFMPAERAFRPCTPHLLIAIARSLRWLDKEDLLEGSDYLEFGIFRGFSLWYAQMMARDIGVTHMRFFGFDSFQGLPEPRGVDSDGEFRAGDYSCLRRDVEQHLDANGVDWSRTFLVEGWFNRTLSGATRERYALRRCGLCVIDCDLYESTAAVLAFLTPLIQNPMIVLFDDWNSFGASDEKGERRAFTEFLGRNPTVSAEPFCAFGGHGQGFVLQPHPASVGEPIEINLRASSGARLRCSSIAFPRSSLR